MKSLYSMLIIAIFAMLVAVPSHGEDYPTPPPGEIWGGYLDAINVTRTEINYIIGQVQPGDDGQSSPWFSKLQTIKAQLDLITTSRALTDFFAIVPSIAEVFQEQEPLSFVMEAYGPLANLSVPLIMSAEAYIEQQNGSVSTSALANFVKMFAVGNGFVSEANWEDRAIPIDAPGVMILNADAVVTQLKTGLWQEAKQFIGGETTSGAFFSRYNGNGDGLTLLKTKYAANQSAIEAKFSELKTWSNEQEQQAAAGN